MQVDLPALERPTKAISGTSRRGKCFSSGAVVKNLAVCSQPKAIFGFGLASGAGGEEGVVVVMAKRWWPQAISERLRDAGREVSGMKVQSAASKGTAGFACA